MKFRDLAFSLSRHGTNYAFSGIAVAVLNLISVPVYTRLFSPSELGLYFALTSAGQFLGIVFSLSLESALCRYYYEDRGNPLSFQIALSSYLIFVAIWGIVCFCVLSLFQSFLLQPLVKTSYWPLLCLMLLTANLQAIMILLTSILQMDLKSKFVGIMNFTLSLFIFLVTVALVRYASMGIEARLLSQVLINTALAVIILIYLARRKAIRFSLSWQVIKRGLRFSGPLIPNSGLGWITNLSDRLLLRYYNMSAAGGVYSMGYDLSRMGVSLLSDSIFTTYVPMFYREMNRDERAFSLTHARFVSYCLLLVSAASFSLALFSEEIVRILMPRSYAGASGIMSVIAFAFLLATLYRPFILVLSYRNKTSLISLIAFISAFTNLGLNLLLIPRLGSQGAAWTTLISLGIWAGLSFAFAQRYFPIRYEYGRLFKILAVHLLSLEAFSLLSSHRPSLLLYLAGKVVCLLLYPAALYLSGFFTTEEIHHAAKLRSPKDLLLLLRQKQDAARP